ncbi:transglutaminase family protein [Acidobacteriota bacterium]
MYIMKKLCLSYLFIFFGSLCIAQEKVEKLYFGVESNGELYGYSEFSVSHTEKNGKPIILLEEKVHIKISALGFPVDTEIHWIYHLDPETGQFFYYDVDVVQKGITTGKTIVIDENMASVTLKPNGKSKKIPLPSDVILKNSLFFPYLIRDFIEKNQQKKSFDIYDIRDDDIHRVSITMKTVEKLELAGIKFSAVAFDEIDHKTGAKVRYWIDPDSGYLLKAIFPTRTIFLTDSTIKDRIGIADIDYRMLFKVDKVIRNEKSIAYMKIKVSLKPIGAWITNESLNTPGQDFEGTVENNDINGIFEIANKTYDGKGAPPFPHDFSKDKAIKKYLEPEDVIESTDPVIINKAREITKDSQDSWDASKRLSKWVSDEIVYAIPGGGSARRTYDLRLGECSAHSLLLAAFCRAVGIPARVVWGCMYISRHGGNFTQHAWNEVYMGKDGWIPVDSTAHEIDYVDSGHIRLSELLSKNTAFSPEKMEILDYKVDLPEKGFEETFPDSEDSKKYPDIKALINRKSMAFEKFVSGVEAVESAEEATGLLNNFTRDLHDLLPAMRELSNKYENFDDMLTKNPPKDVIDEWKISNKLEEEVEVALSKLFPYASNAEVIKAFQAFRTVINEIMEILNTRTE